MANEDLGKGKNGDGQDGQGQGSQGDHQAGKPAGGGIGEGKPEGDAGKGEGKSVSYDSFQELLKEKKAAQRKLAEFESKAKAESDQKLIEDGKLKELYEGEKAARLKALDRVKMAELKAAATKSGMIDPDYLKILIDQVEFDADGIPQNVDSFFDSLKEKKPHLFAQEIPPAPGHANAGGKPWKPGSQYTEKQIAAMSNEEFLKVFPDIQDQMKQGKIT